MSNKVSLQPITFTNNITGDTKYGFTIQDNYNSFYCDTYETTIEDELSQVLIKIWQGHFGEAMAEMVDSIRTVEKGIELGDTWMDWDEITHLICY